MRARRASLHAREIRQHLISPPEQPAHTLQRGRRLRDLQEEAEAEVAGTKNPEHGTGPDDRGGAPRAEPGQREFHSQSDRAGDDGGRPEPAEKPPRERGAPYPLPDPAPQEGVLDPTSHARRGGQADRSETGVEVERAREPQACQNAQARGESDADRRELERSPRVAERVERARVEPGLGGRE